MINQWLRGQRTFLYLHKNTIEGDRRKQTDEQTRTNLGLTKSRGRYCNTICMCIPDSIYGLTLAWVTSENSTMLLESDILRLFFTGPYLVSSPICSVSGVDCPSVDPRQPLCSPLSCPVSTALSPLQPPTLSWVASSTLVRVPLPLPDTARFFCPRILCLVSRQNRQLNRLLWQPNHIVLQMNNPRRLIHYSTKKQKSFSATIFKSSILIPRKIVK